MKNIIHIRYKLLCFFRTLDICNKVLKQVILYAEIPRRFRSEWLSVRFPLSFCFSCFSQRTSNTARMTSFPKTSLQTLWECLPISDERWTVSWKKRIKPIQHWDSMLVETTNQQTACFNNKNSLCFMVINIHAGKSEGCILKQADFSLHAKEKI